jgi:predicted nucleotidyltransferase
MKFHRQFDDLLGNPLRVRLLRVMIQSPKQGFTGRDLARQCESSPSQTISALLTLEQSGLIYHEIAGRSHVWRLLENHVLADHLLRLFQSETEPLEALQKQLRNALAKLPVQDAWLFGSIARGDERSSSDVDLLVEVKTKSDKARVELALSALSPDIAIRFGNPLSSLILDQDQIRSGTHSQLLDIAHREGVQLSE